MQPPCKRQMIVQVGHGAPQTFEGTMRTYLADKPIFKKLRKRFGIEKPYALEWDGWKKWKQETQSAHPVGYFLTETLPDILSRAYDKLTAPYYNTRYYIRNRFYRKCHVLPTGFKPGEYHDLDSRLLHGIMQSLVDFVEVEKAHMMRWTTPDHQYKFKNGRCAEAGLDYLKWEMNLTHNESWVDKDDPRYGTPTSQAETAKEIYKIYDWWKNTYPNRPDSMEASGWNAYCDRLDREGKEMFSNIETAADMEESDRTHKKLREIEAQYDQEEQDMLIRLIKIRRSLWT